VQARVDVTVDETVAREVAEVFRINGVAVKATAAGPGRVDAEATERDADRLARAEEVSAATCAGLDQLRRPQHRQAAAATDAADLRRPRAHRLAGSTAEPAHIVTADGSRYSSVRCCPADTE
jgi:hypothetical protein